MKKRNRPDPALQRHLKRALPVAVEAALEAGEFLKKKFGRIRHLEKKADSTLVSEADKGAEKIVIRKILKHFPQDQIIGEESGLLSKRRLTPFRWHIDPLDGTTNFVHGFPLFCVSVGLEYEDNNLVLGTIFQPIPGNLYTAMRGSGAYHKGKKLSVSKIDKVSDSLLTTGFSYRRDIFLAQEMESFSQIIQKSRALRRTGSAALDLTFVACGQFDGFWERGLSSWDVAAGIVLLNEAGGTVSQINGSPHRLDSKGILATNTKIHKELSDILASQP